MVVVVVVVAKKKEPTAEIQNSLYIARVQQRSDQTKAVAMAVVVLPSFTGGGGGAFSSAASAGADAVRRGPLQRLRI